MAPRRTVTRSELAALIPNTPAAADPTAPSTPLAPASVLPSSSSSLSQLWSSYLQNTHKDLKLIDGLQLFLMLTGIAQFLYCILVTNYPFNAFLGGFSATVGQFVLAASLRSQVNPENKAVFPTISPERAFADFVFGSLVLHFFVFNYLG